MYCTLPLVTKLLFFANCSLIWSSVAGSLHLTEQWLPASFPVLHVYVVLSGQRKTCFCCPYMRAAMLMMWQLSVYYHMLKTIVIALVDTETS